MTLPLITNCQPTNIVLDYNPHDSKQSVTCFFIEVIELPYKERKSIVLICIKNAYGLLF